MTKTQLECFLRTAQELSFTKAAEQLFISRQVVSAHVKALEAELGFALLAREGRHLVLTGAGRIFFQQLAVMEKQFSLLLEEARGHGGRQELRIGICEMSDEWEWRLFDFIERHPGCIPHIETLPMTRLPKQLTDGLLDFIILPYNDIKNASAPFLNVERLGPLPLVTAISRSNPLAYKPFITLAELEGEPLYVVATESCESALPNVIGHLESGGLRPREVITLPNYKSIELALSGGQGFCITFEAFLKNRDNRLRLLPLEQLPNERAEHLAAVYRRGVPLLAELAAFLRDSGL